MHASSQDRLFQILYLSKFGDRVSIFGPVLRFLFDNLPTIHRRLPDHVYVRRVHPVLAEKLHWLLTVTDGRFHQECKAKRQKQQKHAKEDSEKESPAEG